MIHYHKLPCGYPVTTYHHVVILLPHITTWWPYNHKPLCCDLLPHITSWWPLTHKRDVIFHHQVDLPPTLLQEHRRLRQGEMGHIIVIDGQDPVPDLYGAFSVIPRVKDVHFALVYTLRIAMFCFLFIYYRGISYFFSLCIHDSRNMSNVFVKKIYCRIYLLNFSENCLPYLSAGPPGRTWVTISGRVLCCCSW